jgi:hypothetical protein
MRGFARQGIPWGSCSPGPRLSCSARCRPASASRSRSSGAAINRSIAASQLFGVVRPDGLAPKSLRDDIFKM